MNELALHIYDLVLNSIRANANNIDIIIQDNQDIITINIIDDGDGMNINELKKVTDPFYTTKTNHQIGLGIPLFKQNVEATGGQFLISSVINQGTKIEAKLFKNHLDCLPLGNLAASLAAIIQINPNINYLFKYQNDDFKFILDTKEIKKLLGDNITINQPEIIMWLKNYIEEGLWR